MAEGAEAFLLKHQSLESLPQEIRKPAGEVRRRRRRNGKRAGERRSSEAGGSANSGPKWWRRLAPRKWFAA